MERIGQAIVLLGVFLMQVVSGGLSTAWTIVSPRIRPEPRIVRVRYEGVSVTGAALLACLVTLTPGETVIDFDPEHQELLLHVLNGRDPAGVIADIHNRFERPLRVVFPGGAA